MGIGNLAGKGVISYVRKQSEYRPYTDHGILAHHHSHKEWAYGAVSLYIAEF